MSDAKSEEERRAELEKRTPSFGELMSISVLGPQKQPASVPQIEAQTKAVRRELDQLSMEDFEAALPVTADGKWIKLWCSEDWEAGS